MATANDHSLVESNIHQSAEASTDINVPQFQQQVVPVPPGAWVDQLGTPLLPGGSKQRRLTDFIEGSSQLSVSLTNTGERQNCHCCKCGHVWVICQGAQSVRNCQNPCQDCGKMDCEGRDPKNWKTVKDVQTKVML